MAPRKKPTKKTTKRTKAAKALDIKFGLGGPHPYWRVRGIAQDTSGSVSIAELSMSATEGGEDLCTGGSAVCSNQHISFPATNAFDNDIGTFWYAGGAAGAEEWIGYHFGSSVEIVEVTVDCRHDGYFTQTPRTIYVDYSDNGSDWTNAWAGLLPVPWIGEYVGSQKLHAPDGTKRRWRINVSAPVNAGDNLTIAALELRTAISGSNAATGGVAICDIVASNVSQYLPSTMFDGNDATYWSCGNVFPHYAGYDFPAGVNIVEVSIKAVSWQTAPKTFDIDSSIDNGLNWVTEWSVANSGDSTTWTGGGPVVFNNPPPDIAVSGVTISPTTATITNIGTQQFSATVLPADATNKTVTWSIISGHGSIDSSGLYTPNANYPGETITIRATSNDTGVYGEATVTLTNWVGLYEPTVVRGESFIVATSTNAANTAWNHPSSATIDGIPLTRISGSEVTVSSGHMTTFAVPYSIGAGTYTVTFNFLGVGSSTASLTVVEMARTRFSLINAADGPFYAWYGQDGNGGSSYIPDIATFPSPEQAEATATYGFTTWVAVGASLHRAHSVFGVLGTASVTPVVTIPASQLGAARVFITGFSTKRIGNLRSIRAGTWSFRGVIDYWIVASNTHARADKLCVYVYRPSTNAVIGTVFDNTNDDSVRYAAEMTEVIGTKKVVAFDFPGDNVVGIEDGDTLCFEWWATFNVSGTTTNKLFRPYYGGLDDLWSYTDQQTYSGSNQPGTAIYAPYDLWSPAIPVTSVTVSPATVTVKTEGTRQFTTSVLPADANDTTVSWSIVEASGGSSDSSGLYTAPNTEGTFTIKATNASGAFGTATITVQRPRMTTIGIVASC